ncbi:MAG TPA: hypothetical protein VIX91_13310, partial [Candidatus Acidoferrum sp.]
MVLAATHPTCFHQTGKVDKSSVASLALKDADHEKEWQAIIDYFRSLPVKGNGNCPLSPLMSAPQRSV